jgi:hypothetical protein
MTSFVTLAVTHLELQELKKQLAAEHISIEGGLADPGKVYDIGQILATFEVTVPTLAVLAGWM